MPPGGLARRADRRRRGPAGEDRDAQTRSAADFSSDWKTAEPRGTSARGTGLRISFSMSRSWPVSSGPQKLEALPLAAIRAVRPMRCT